MQVQLTRKYFKTSELHLFKSHFFITDKPQVQYRYPVLCILIRIRPDPK
jgi:hypothetical protein